MNDNASSSSPSSPSPTMRTTTPKLNNSSPFRRKKKNTSQKAWVPSYLSEWVHPLSTEDGDLWASPFFDKRLVAQLMAEGFLPIATRKMLLPKLHIERCVISWKDFHISKSVRKKGKKWNMSVNQDFDGVVQGCRTQHGISWLYPSIVTSFKAIHNLAEEGLKSMIISPDGKLKGYRPVRIYSIEIWSCETGQLVAGELGYTVGDIYTSLTGFSNEDSAGSVQLAALGMLLQQQGFRMWDLGMDLEYKKKLGAHLMKREIFVEEVRKAREEGPDLILKCSERVNIKGILKPEQNRQSQPIPTHTEKVTWNKDKNSSIPEKVHSQVQNNIKSTQSRAASSNNNEVKKKQKIKGPENSGNDPIGESHGTKNRQKSPVSVHSEITM